MNIMTKRGNLDNIVTYEHICDTTADLANINKQYATLGSTAIVIKGDDDELCAYMATSEGEWVPIMLGSAGGADVSCSCPHLVLEETKLEKDNSNATQIYKLNYTFAEIKDAFENGTVVMKITYEEEEPDITIKSVKNVKFVIDDDLIPPNNSIFFLAPITRLGYNADEGFYVQFYDEAQDDNYYWFCADENEYPYRSIITQNNEQPSS